MVTVAPTGVGPPHSPRMRTGPGVARAGVFLLPRNGNPDAAGSLRGALRLEIGNGGLDPFLPMGDVARAAWGLRGRSARRRWDLVRRSGQPVVAEQQRERDGRGADDQPGDPDTPR